MSFRSQPEGGLIGKKIAKAWKWYRIQQQYIICRKCKGQFPKSDFSKHLKTKHPKIKESTNV